jgi:hypothetical protein
MLRRAGRHLKGVVYHFKDFCIQCLQNPASLTFNVILTYFNNHSKDSCVQCLQDPVSSTFNVILTYGHLSGPYTNERRPEDDDLLVETHVGSYISFKIKLFSCALVCFC